MKVLCKHNDPDYPPKGISSHFYYGLELQKEYLVMGIILTEENQLWYLIDEGNPSCFPSQLFEVTDAAISSGWCFKICTKDDRVFPFKKVAIWGYYELVFDETHYEQLVDREREALHIYFRRKIEFEKSLE